MVIIKSENQLKMKKVTRILGLCALVALATVSCKKDDNNAPQGGKSFRATINQPTDGAKTHIGEWEGQPNYLLWNAEDDIMVYTEDGTSATFTTNDANALVATFTGNIKEADKYVAFYPAANATEVVGNKVTLQLPATQNYAGDNIASGAYPMAAYCKDVTSDVDFEFHSPCAVVCLPLKGDVKVTSIELSGNSNEKLAGSLEVTLGVFDPANPMAGGWRLASSQKTVTLDCGNGVDLDDTDVTNFYFVVATPMILPDFSGGLKFVVNYEGGSETLETSSNNSLYAETILTMPEKEVNKPTPPIGDFTVGMNNDGSMRKVTIAPGNLWYKKATNTWHLEEQQWNYHTGIMDADEQGFFAWPNPNNQNGRYANYLDEVEEFVEWGNLTICKPGSTETYAPGTWRSLNWFEMMCLLEWREGPEYYNRTLHRLMEVNEVKCLVLAPDNYTGEIENATWEQLEAAGSFALPMAGGYESLAQWYFEEGTEVGWYTTTLNTPDHPGQVHYMCATWNNQNIDIDNACASRYHMYTVRLVKNTTGWE